VFGDGECLAHTTEIYLAIVARCHAGNNPRIVRKVLLHEVHNSCNRSYLCSCAHADMSAYIHISEHFLVCTSEFPSHVRTTNRIPKHKQEICRTTGSDNANLFSTFEPDRRKIQRYRIRLTMGVALVIWGNAGTMSTQMSQEITRDRNGLR
jgi:hypothetical protein